MEATNSQLKAGRAGHCMAVLGDDSVLVTGGMSPDGQVLDTGELLNLPEKKATPVVQRHLPRVRHSCVTLPDSRVLLIGGMNADGKPEGRIEVFDPTHGTFSVLTSLETARVYHQALLLPDNQVLVTGGIDGDGNPLNTAELMDPAAAKAVLLPVTMNSPRYHHEARLLRDGLVLITGGAGGPKSSLSAELFDPREKRFSPPIEMHVERVIHTATVLNDNRVFTFSNGLGELFSMADRRFQVVPGVGGPKIRDGHTATSLLDGKVLILGGGMPEFSEDVLGAPVLYDPKTNVYLDLNLYNALVNRADHAAVRLKDGRILITGGRTIDQPATDDVVVYDPVTREFQKLR